MPQYTFYAASVTSNGCTDTDPYADDKDLYVGYDSSSACCAAQDTDGNGINLNASSLGVNGNITTIDNGTAAVCGDSGDSESHRIAANKWYYAVHEHDGHDIGHAVYINSSSQVATHIHCWTTTASSTPTVTASATPTVSDTVTETVSATSSVTITPTSTTVHDCAGNPIDFNAAEDFPDGNGGAGVNTSSWNEEDNWDAQASVSLDVGESKLWKFTIHADDADRSFEFTTCDDGTSGDTHPTTGGMHEIDTHLCLYDSDYNLVTENDDGEPSCCLGDSTGYGSCFKASCLAAGDYYIVVANADSISGSFGLGFRMSSATCTATATASVTPTLSATDTPTATTTETPTASETPTISATDTPTASATHTATASTTHTATASTTHTATISTTHTPTASATATDVCVTPGINTESGTANTNGQKFWTGGRTDWETGDVVSYVSGGVEKVYRCFSGSSANSTDGFIPRNTYSPITSVGELLWHEKNACYTLTATPSLTATISVTHTPTASTTDTPTATTTETPTASETPTISATHSPTLSATISETPSATATTSATATVSETPSATYTVSETHTVSETPTITATQTISDCYNHRWHLDPGTWDGFWDSGGDYEIGDVVSYIPTYSSSTPGHSFTAGEETGFRLYANGYNTFTPPSDQSSYWQVVDLCRTFTATASATVSETPTASVTHTISATPTVSETPTATLTVSETPTASETPTLSATITATLTASETPTATVTPTDSETPSATPTVSETPTATATPTVSETPTATPTVSETPTASETSTLTATISATPTLTHVYVSPTHTDPTSTVSATISATETPSATLTITVTPTVSETVSATPTITSTPTVSETPTASATTSETPTGTATPTISDTPTFTATHTPTVTPTLSETPTASETPTFTATQTPTVSATTSATATFTATPTVTTIPDLGDGGPFCATFARRCELSDPQASLAQQFDNEDVVGHICSTNFAGKDWNVGAITDEAFTLNSNNLCYTQLVPGTNRRLPKYNLLCTMPIFAQRDSDNAIVYASVETVEDDCGIQAGHPAHDFAKKHGGKLVGRSPVSQGGPQGDSQFFFLLSNVKNPSGSVNDFTEVYTPADTCSTCLAGGEISLTVHHVIGGQYSTTALTQEDEDEDQSDVVVDNSLTGGSAIPLTALTSDHYVAISNNNSDQSDDNKIELKSVESNIWLTHDHGDTVPPIGDSTYSDLSDTTSSSVETAFSSDEANRQGYKPLSVNILDGQSHGAVTEKYTDHEDVEILGTNHRVLSSRQGAMISLQSLKKIKSTDYSWLPLMDSKSRIAHRVSFGEIHAQKNSTKGMKKIANSVDLETIITPPPYAFRVSVATTSNNYGMTCLTKTQSKLKEISCDLGKLSSNSLGFDGDGPFIVEMPILNDSIGNLLWYDAEYSLLKAQDTSMSGATNIIDGKEDKFVTVEPIVPDDDNGARINANHSVGGDKPTMEIQIPKLFKAGAVDDIIGGAGAYKFIATFKVANDISYDRSNKGAPATPEEVPGYTFKYEVMWEAPSAYYDTDSQKKQPTKRRRRRKK